MKQVLRFLALAALICVPWVTQGQSLSDYTVTTGTETYTSIADNGGTLLTNVTGDSGKQTVALPFEFKFGETTYPQGTNVYVRADGYLYFGSDPGNSSKTAWTSSSNYYVIAPFLNYDGRIDRSGGPDGAAYYAIVNDVNSNPEMLVIEFVHVECYYSPYGDYNFQVRLHSNGNISAVYGESTLSTYSSYDVASHNFFLTCGTADKIALSGSYAEPIKITSGDLPNFTTAPVEGTVITFVRPVFTCPKPTLSDVAQADIEPRSATVRWTLADASQTLFDIYWSTTNTAPTEATVPGAANQSGNSYEITGLDPATTYYVWIRGNCGTASEPDVSGGWTLAKSFTTGCAAISSGTWGFESPNPAGTPSNPLPACWTRPTTGANTSYPYAYNSSSNSHNGSFYLYFYSGSYNTNTCVAVLPEIEGGLNGKRLSLYEKGAYSFSVGYMTDPTDASTFVPVLTQTGTSSYPSSPYIIDFGEYTGDPQYIAIKSNFTSTYQYIYIDDVTLGETPSCLEPTDLNVTNIATTTANLAWVTGNPGQDHWDIYYSTNSTAPTNETVPTVSNTDQNPYPMTELTSASTYYVWVRGNCGGDNSEWSTVYSFSTECEAITDFPWSENFESYEAGDFSDPCWVNEHISGSGTKIFKVYTSTNGGNSTHQLQLPDQDGGTMTKLRLPKMTLPNNNYQFALDVYRSNSTYSPSDNPYEGVRVFASADGEIAGATELAFIPRQFDETNGIIPAESAAGWYTYELPLGISGTCYIILKGENRYCTSTYMDNLVVEQIPTCKKPKTPTCASKTAHTATLSWTNGEAGQTAWQIAYSTEANFDPNSVTPVDVTTNPATIDGLEATTTYYAYVRANCGGGDYSAWSVAKATFATIAGNAAPTGLAVDNSTITSSAATVNWTGVATNDYHQSFDIYYSGLSTRPEPLDADSLIEGLTDASYAFTHLDAEKKYYVWVRDNCGTDGYSEWSSSTYFTTASACQTPAASDITASNITNDGATITWNTFGQTGFNLRYSDDESTWHTVLTATTPYPLTHLDGNTTYYVQVQATCNTEAWSASKTFTTKCDPIDAFPWSENFESYAAGNFSNPCWVNEHISGSGSYIFKVYTSTNGTNSTHQLQLPDMSSGTLTKLRLPEMTLPNANYQFTLDVYRNTSTTNYQEGIRVYASTDGNIEGATELAFISRSYTTSDGGLIPAEAASGWYTYELPIGISGTCYIILRGESQYGSATYMDNLVVEEIPTCKKPKTPTCDSKTAHTATLSWTNGEAGQTAWQIAYSTDANFDPASVTPVDVTENPATISGLAQNTTYYAYVRANCGNGDYSAWSVAKATFTTITGKAAPTGLAVDNSTITSSAATVNWTGVATNDYHQSFDIYYSGLSTRPEPLDADSLIEGLTDASYAFTHLDAEKKYYVWVRDNCGADGLSNWSSSIYFTTASDCQTPDGLAATNVSSNSATITWNTYGQTEFNLRYSDDEGAHWTDVNDVTQPYTLDGVLTANTAYQVQVQATCAADLVNDWSAVLNFTTECEPYTITVATPYIQDFESPVVTTTYTQVGEMPNCWDNYPETASGPKILAADASYNYATSGQVLYFYGSGNNYAALPEFTNALSDLQITFKYATESSSNGALTLGYITAADNGTYNTFTPIGESYAANSTYYQTLTPITVYLNDVPAEATRLVFRWYYSGQWGANIDDIKVSLIIPKDITANSWYAIASPVHNSGNDETLAGVANLTSGTYDMLRYNEANATWESQKTSVGHPGFSTMERGRGYIYRTNAAKTLFFDGDVNSGNIDVDLDATPAAGTMKGWNLLGNPYLTQYAPTVNYYRLSASGTWEPKVAGESSSKVNMGEGFLVKAASATTYTFTETHATKSAPASTIAFTVSNDEFTDIAYARFSSEEGLPKISHLNPEAPMLSIDGYAIANLNEGTESFPMSFSGQGSYTLTVSGNTDVTGYLHLVDRLTGRDIDLLSTPSYSFTGSPVSDRFTVKLTPDANEGNSTSRFAIFDGNSLIVNGEGTLEVYDVMGRRLMSAEVTGSEYRISGSDLHTGVYVLRMNGNSQKIVIK